MGQQQTLRAEGEGRERAGEIDGWMDRRKEKWRAGGFLCCLITNSENVHSKKKKEIMWDEEQ